MKKPLSNKQKKSLKLLLAKADQAFSLGRMDVLNALCRQLDQVRSKHPDTAHYRGVIAVQSGALNKAVACFRQAVAVAPDRAAFHVNLAAALLLQHKPDAALDAYQQALNLDKQLLAGQIGYARCLLQLGYPVQAIERLQALPAKYSYDQDVCMLAFHACYDAGRLDEAGCYLHNILQVNPSHADAHYGLALLAAAFGRFQEAELEIRAALAVTPGYADAYKLLADIHRFTDMQDADLQAMLELFQQPELALTDRATLAFALGKAMHDMAAYDRAFDFYQQGNVLRRSASSYNHSTELKRMRVVACASSPPPQAESELAGSDLPVFIVGMPRCGSTLVEQILAAHPDVEARGECNVFRQLLQEQQAPDLLCADQTLYQDRQWRALGEEYLARLENQQAAVRITDKTLSNILWLGAIHAALPKARIVHVRRNPLDNCLSIYRSDLQGDDFRFGFDLRELGEYYLAYLQLMQHWRDVLPTDYIYELDYEALVADQEGETRKLLQACGLPWQKACLQFERVNNHVLTASAVQVRKGMSAGSVAAWRQYEPQLQTLAEMFAAAGIAG